MHLRLIKGLSYDGVVRASAAHPDVFVDDPEKYTALLESGYFEALPDAYTVTGHLDTGFLGEMDEEQLDKLADVMGVDTTGKDKAEGVAAVAEEPVEVPDISKMKLDELKEFAEDNGIDLTGCTNERDFDRDDNIPRITWGRYGEENGRKKLGMSVEVNHRFIDGLHLGKFYEKLQADIDAL